MALWVSRVLEGLSRAGQLQQEGQLVCLWRGP